MSTCNSLSRKDSGKATMSFTTALPLLNKRGSVWRWLIFPSQNFRSNTANKNDCTWTPWVLVMRGTKNKLQWGGGGGKRGWGRWSNSISNVIHTQKSENQIKVILLDRSRSSVNHGNGFNSHGPDLLTQSWFILAIRESKLKTQSLFLAAFWASVHVSFRSTLWTPVL